MVAIGPPVSASSSPPVPLVVAIAACAILLLAVHTGPRASAWPWSLVCLAVGLSVAHSEGFVKLPLPRMRLPILDGNWSAVVPRLSLSATDAAAQRGTTAPPSPHRVIEALGERHVYPPSVQEFMPDLFSVQRLEGKSKWLRGDVAMARSLLYLRSYRLTDGPTVRHIIGLLGEFYRRYDRLLNRPWVVHVSNEYTILRDISLSVLNSVHELNFSRPPMLNRGLDVVTREVLSRTSRMLRVLRHKYPKELRGQAMATAGSAPRAFDARPAASPSHPSYAVFV